MLMPLDEETVVAMVGVGSVENLPKEFMDEYLLRATMLARAGKAGPIGAVAMLHLIREFKIEPAKPKVAVEVDDWDTMAKGSRIIFRGQGGVYCGNASLSTVLIRLDGRNAQEEVLANEVKSDENQIAPGIPNSAFEREPLPAAIRHTEPRSGIQGEIIKPELDPTAQEQAEALLSQWGMVDAGVPIWCRGANEGEWIEGEYVDVSEQGAAGKSSTLVVSIGGKRTIVDSADVTLENPKLETATAE